MIYQVTVELGEKRLDVERIKRYNVTSRKKKENFRQMGPKEAILSNDTQRSTHIDTSKRDGGSTYCRGPAISL